MPGDGTQTHPLPGPTVWTTLALIATPRAPPPDHQNHYLFLGLSSVRWKVPRLLRTALGLTQRLGPVLDYLPVERVGSGVKTAEGEGVCRGDVTGDGIADIERVATGAEGGVAVGALVGWSVLAVVGFGAGLGLVVRAGAGM